MNIKLMQGGYTSDGNVYDEVILGCEGKCYTGVDSFNQRDDKFLKILFGEQGGEVNGQSVEVLFTGKTHPFASISGQIFHLKSSIQNAQDKNKKHIVFRDVDIESIHDVVRYLEKGYQNIYDEKSEYWRYGAEKASASCVVFSVDKNGNRKIRGGLDLIRNGSESYLSAIVDAKILEKAEERNRRIKVEQGKQMSFS